MNKLCEHVNNNTKQYKHMNKIFFFFHMSYSAQLKVAVEPNYLALAPPM